MILVFLTKLLFPYLKKRLSKKDWLGKEIGTEVRAANGMNFYCYGGNKDDEGNISIYVLNLGTTDRDTHYSFNDRGICRGQEKLGLGK